MKRTSYKMYHPASDVQALDTHGQSWHGETVQEGIDFCKLQLIEPVFRKYLPMKGTVLEAGSGTGRWVFYLRDLGYDITGIDLAVDALRIAKEYDPKAPIHADDILHTSYPDRSFDAVISLGVVEHFEEGPQLAFQEASRVLKDDGLFFVTVPSQNLNRKLFANPMKEFKRWLMKRKGVLYAFEEYRYTRNEFSELLAEANFEILYMFPDDYRPPKNMGLFVDYPFLRHRTNKWELNSIGKLYHTVCHALSPWLACAGIMWVCRKKI